MDIRDLTLSRRAAILAGAGVTATAAAAVVLTRARPRHGGATGSMAERADGQGSAAGSAVPPSADPEALRDSYGPEEEALASSLAAVTWTSEGGAVRLAFTGEAFTLTDASGTTRTGAYVLSDAETRTETGEGNVTARITDFTVRTAGGTFPGELQEVTGPEGGTATSLACGAFGDSAFSADWGAL